MAQHPSVFDAAVTQLALIKLTDMDLAAIHRHITHLALQSLAGAGEVSVTVVEAGRPFTAASTGETALRLDELQYQIKLGPCLQAAAEKTVVRIRDTAQDTRWNRWPIQAAAAGAGSVLSVPMPILDDLDGALNVYGRVADAFDDDAVRSAGTFAELAAVTLTNAYLYDRTAARARQMHTAMEHRAVIEQAKGIIMAERRCTADEAFAVLAKISQDSNRKLRDIAVALVAHKQSSAGPAS